MVKVTRNKDGSVRKNSSSKHVLEMKKAKTNIEFQRNARKILYERMDKQGYTGFTKEDFVKSLENEKGVSWKYTPDHCEMVIELGGQGASQAEMCRALNITEDTLYKWMKKFPEFLSAIKHAKGLSQGWWEKLNRDGASGQRANTNPTHTIWGMKNLFPNSWKDKIETVVTTPPTISKEAIESMTDEQALAMLKKMDEASGAMVDITSLVEIEDGEIIE